MSRKFAAKPKMREQDYSPKRKSTPDDETVGSCQDQVKVQKTASSSGWIDVNKNLHVYNPGGLEGRAKVGVDFSRKTVTTVYVGLLGWLIDWTI